MLEIGTHTIILYPDLPARLHGQDAESFRSISEFHCAEPGIDLSEDILLPLLCGTIAQNACVLDELLNAGRPEAPERVEFLGDVAIALDGAVLPHQFPARSRKRVDAVGIV